MEAIHRTTNFITSWLPCKINNIRVTVKNKFGVTKVKAKTLDNIARQMREDLGRQMEEDIKQIRKSMKTEIKANLQQQMDNQEGECKSVEEQAPGREVSTRSEEVSQ